MSWDIELDTSNYRTRHQTTSMFRLEEARPFDPSMLSLRFAGAAQRTAPRPTRARVNPFSFGDSYDDEEERASLMGRNKTRFTNVQTITLLALACVLTLVCVLVGVMYWQFTSGVMTLRDISRPYMVDAVNHTLSILHNIDHSSISAQEMADGARDLTSSAVPAIQHALQQSAAIVDRLEKLARNPVLQLSLQNPGAGR